MKYFHLEKTLKFDKHKHTICSRKALKNFTKILVLDDLLLSKIHNLLINEIFI